MEPSASGDQTQLSLSWVLTPATTARQAGSTRRQHLLLCPSQDLPESEPPPDPTPGRKAAALRLHTTNPLVSPPRSFPPPRAFTPFLLLREAWVPFCKQNSNLNSEEETLRLRRLGLRTEIVRFSGKSPTQTSDTGCVRPLHLMRKRATQMGAVGKPPPSSWVSR